MVRAMFPGSFDPPTIGHVNIIERSCRLFDEVIVVVANNIHKRSTFTAEERIEMLAKCFKDNSKVRLVQYSGLIANFAKENDVDVIVRGVRAQDDFAYEFELAMNNRMIDKDVEVVFIPTDQRYLLIRSSNMKEYVRFGVDIAGMVPDCIKDEIVKRLSSS